MSDERLTVDRLNDDGVVFLIMTIFAGNKHRDRNAKDTDEDDQVDRMERLFGGGLQIGNSHNGDYQLGISTAHSIVRKYTKY